MSTTNNNMLKQLCKEDNNGTVLIVALYIFSI